MSGNAHIIFPKGTRVELPSRFTTKPNRIGVVVGYSHDKTGVRIAWPGIKKPVLRLASKLIPVVEKS